MFLLHEQYPVIGAFYSLLWCEISDFPFVLSLFHIKGRHPHTHEEPSHRDERDPPSQTIRAEFSAEVRTISGQSGV